MNRPEGWRIFGLLAYVPGILFLRRFGARASHAQRLEDLVPHEREEGPPRRGFNGGTDQYPAVRRLPNLRSRLEQKGTIRKNWQRIRRPFAPFRRQPPIVRSRDPYARHISHQMAKRHGPGLLRKLRDVRLNLLVELDPILLEQDADRRRREGRRGGSHPESRLRCHGCVRLDVGPAEALGPHEVAADADRHRQSRQILLGEYRAVQSAARGRRPRPIPATVPIARPRARSAAPGAAAWPSPTGMTGAHRSPRSARRGHRGR